MKDTEDEIANDNGPPDNGSGLVGYGKSPDYGGPKYTRRMNIEAGLVAFGFLLLTVGLPLLIMIKQQS